MATVPASEKSADVASVASAYFAAVGERDVEAMVALWEPGGMDVLHGMAELPAPDGIRDWFGSLFTAFPDFRFEVLDLVAEGEKAAVHWRATGTFDGSGSFEGMVPTGAGVDITGCDLLTIRDGRIHRNDAYVNGTEMGRQLGALPPAGSLGERTMLAALNLRTRLSRRIRRR
jgi:predicted ester cyclase